MSEQVRIDFYVEVDKYGEIEFFSPTFKDVQRDTEVAEEVLVGRTIEAIDCGTESEILLTLSERK